METDTSTPSETSQGRVKHSETRPQEVLAERTKGKTSKVGKVFEKVVYKVSSDKVSSQTPPSTSTNILSSAGSGLTPRAFPKKAATQGTGKGKQNKTAQSSASPKPKVKPGTPGTYRGNQSGNFQRVMPGTPKGKTQPGTFSGIKPGNSPQTSSHQPLSYAEAARRRIP